MMAEATRGMRGELPVLSILGDIAVQLGGVFIHTGHQAGDIRHLLGVGRFCIQGVFLRPGSANASLVSRSCSSSSTVLSVKLNS